MFVLSFIFSFSEFVCADAMRCDGADAATATADVVAVVVFIAVYMYRTLYYLYIYICGCLPSLPFHQHHHHFKNVVPWAYVWLSKNKWLSCTEIMSGICNEPSR